MKDEIQFDSRRFVKGGNGPCIKVRQPLLERVHYAGTVMMVNVEFKEDGRVRANVVEEMEYQIPPRVLTAWRSARIIQGSCVDARTGEPVEKARAAYMVGNRIYYT